MTEKRGYIGRILKGTDKAIRNGVDAADNALDKAVETSSPVVKEIGSKGEDIGKEAINMSKAGTKKVISGIGNTKRAISGDNPIDTLERIGRMWKEGIITDQEFQYIKNRLLERI